MRLRLTVRARSDPEEISNYIRQHSPLAAKRVEAAIRASLATLRAYPRLGRAQNVSGVRKHVTRRYPYLVYYRIDDLSDEVVILTIRHPARARETQDL